jgi:hypothetical protein
MVICTAPPPCWNPPTTAVFELDDPEADVEAEPDVEGLGTVDEETN